MKKLQTLVAVFVCLLTAIVGMFSVKAASYPTKITGIKKGAVLKYNGYDSLFYKTNSNYKMFCTKFHVADVGSSCTIAGSQWSKPVQAGVAAIVKKYNGSKSQKNYYYSELAINEFLYYYGGKDSKNRISTTRDVRNTAGVKPFYTEAVNAYKKANEKFDFKFTNSKITFSESGNYYVSNKLSVKDTNNNLTSYTATVSGAKGAEIYKKSGNSFYVRVPKSSVKVGGNVTIKVTAKGTKSYAVSKNFNCGSNKQTLTPNTTTTEKTTKNVSLSGKITKKGNKLVIYKRIAGTKTNLAGAKLKLVSSDGKFSQTWTSTTSGKEFKNLTAGTYTLTEVSAPEGYTKSDKKVTIKVSYNDKTQSFVVENKPVEKKNTKVNALKIDADTKEALEGAVLVVKDSNGKEIDKWTTTKETHEVKNITATGKYTLSEVSAPEGYEKSNEVKSFEVKKDDQTVSLEYSNKKVITKVEIIKIDSETKQPLAGATLVVKDSNGKIRNSFVSSTEAETIEGLEKGTYTLTETIAPKGYELTNEVKTFEVKYDGKVVKVEMENKPVTVVTGAKISKQDVTNGKELPGAHLVVKNANGEVVKEWISTDTPYEFELAPGKYTLSETIAPEGYQLKTETVEFEVFENGEFTNVVMYNSPENIPDEPGKPDVPTEVEKYPVKISKQDITSKQELPGATLIIKDSTGKEIYRWVSTNTPKEFELPAGDYTLTEIQAPSGYDLSYEVVEFTVKADKSITTEAVMYNSKTPQTADRNIVFLVFTLITAGIGSVFGFKKFRKQL